MPSRSPRASPETSQSRSGMRRPACAIRNRAPGRRPSDTAHPPLRADRVNAPMRDRRARPCARPEISPRRARSQKIAAVERREASIPGARTAQADLRGMRGRPLTPCGPASLAREGCLASTPSACRRSASLVRARTIGKARRTSCLARTMRDGACAWDGFRCAQHILLT